MNVTRREILGLISLTEVLAACSSPTQQAPIKKETPVVKADVVSLDELSPTTKAELRKTLMELPESTIKQFVLKWGMPFLQETMPNKVEFGTHQIDVYDIRLTTLKSDRVGGIFELYAQQKSPQIIAAQPGEMQALFPYESDGQDVDATINYHAGTELASGIDMEITYRYPVGLYIPRFEVSKYLDLRRTVLAKESMTLAYQMVYLALMNKRMDQYNLPKSSMAQGQRVDNLVSALLLGIHRSDRLHGLLDIAPYILTLKAYNSERFNLQSIKFNENEEEIVGTTMKMILADKETFSNVVGVRYNLNQGLTSLPKK